MNTHPHIQYLKRQDIDTARWDACIASAANSLIYGFHFYLDHMADGQWDALVLDDYQAVMPLPWRRKMGIKYLYQPAFTQQTGIFFSNPAPALTPASAPIPAPAPLHDFFQLLQTHFRFAEIYLNYANKTPTLRSRINFILPLDTPYDHLARNYKKDLVRNLKIAAGARLCYTGNFDLHTALDAYQKEYSVRLPRIRKTDYQHFGRLCHFMQQHEQLLIRAVTDSQQQPLAIAVLFKDSHRLYLLQSTTPAKGRKMGANHFLLDQLVREWAGSGLILDFEGSDSPGIAHFYANFGCDNQPYYYYRHNQLPWPLKLLKK